MSESFKVFLVQGFCVLQGLLRVWSGPGTVKRSEGSGETGDMVVGKREVGGSRKTRSE